MPADPLSSSDVLARLPEWREIAEKATPGPWIAASSNRSCVKHGIGEHPGPPSCVYTHQGWSDGEYFGRFISSEATKEEIVGSNEDGPILMPADARYIATFSPPTVLALLRIVEEQREALKALAKAGRGVIDGHKLALLSGSEAGKPRLLALTSALDRPGVPAEDRGERPKHG